MYALKAEVRRTRHVPSFLEPKKELMLIVAHVAGQYTSTFAWLPPVSASSEITNQLQWALYTDHLYRATRTHNEGFLALEHEPCHTCTDMVPGSCSTTAYAASYALNTLLLKPTEQQADVSVQICTWRLCAGGPAQVYHSRQPHLTL